jgi:hypothetical protein
MSVVVEEATAPRVAPQSPVDEEVRDVLREAKGLVAKGWCQGHAREGDKFCAIGALCTAAWETGDWSVMKRARAALGSIIPPDYHSSLMQWNDTPGRTQAEVVALFDEALGV